FLLIRVLPARYAGGGDAVLVPQLQDVGVVVHGMHHVEGLGHPAQDVLLHLVVGATVLVVTHVHGVRGHVVLGQPHCGVVAVLGLTGGDDDDLLALSLGLLGHLYDVVVGGNVHALLVELVEVAVPTSHQVPDAGHVGQG